MPNWINMDQLVGGSHPLLKTACVQMLFIIPNKWNSPAPLCDIESPWAGAPR
jgi:hypothetical protein